MFYVSFRVWYRLKDTYSGTPEKAEAWAKIREVLNHLPETPKDDAYRTLIDSIQLTDLIKVVPSSELEIEPFEHMMITKLQDRIRALEARHDDKATLLTKGAAVQIHIPDQALMKIDEVDVMGDACTIALQERLNEGWRILAVCPPNAQRRLDYILGRRKKDDY